MKVMFEGRKQIDTEVLGNPMCGIQCDEIVMTRRDIQVLNLCLETDRGRLALNLWLCDLLCRFV